uniref:Evasin n=1 Tax=Hyalomma excavatum TaxID=257692 RepID=A0A131X968_9ACAR
MIYKLCVAVLLAVCGSSTSEEDYDYGGGCPVPVMFTESNKTAAINCTEPCDSGPGPALPVGTLCVNATRPPLDYGKKINYTCLLGNCNGKNCPSNGIWEKCWR